MRSQLLLLAQLSPVAWLAACGPDLNPDVAQVAVEEAFAEANPAGRTGLELLGKNVWLQASVFDEGCLTSKNLAFPDDPSRRPSNSGPRISPTYEAQRYLTAATETGFCVYLGDTPTLTVDEVGWGGDRYRVHVTYGMEKATDWFECLEASEKKRMIEVTIDEAGVPQLGRNVDLYRGACPHPLPEGASREGSKRPKKDAAPKPTKAEVVALAKEFDQALWDMDFVKAKEMTSCFNLFEEKKYGSCAVSEFLSLGPIQRGEMRAQDGTPWHEYAFTDLDSASFGLVRDSGDPSVWHATVKHKRTGKTKSFGVQRVGTSWKMLGVVGRQAEAITTARYMNDFHDRTKRDIFDRRMAGEEINEHGEPLNPDAEEQE